MPWILKQVSVNSVMDAETVIQRHLKTVLHVFHLKFWTKLQWNVWVSTVSQIVFNVLLMVSVQHVTSDFTWNNQTVHLVKYRIVSNVPLHTLLVILVSKGIFSTVQNSNVYPVRLLVNLANPAIFLNVLAVLEDIMKLLSVVKPNVLNALVIVHPAQMVLHVQNAIKGTHFQRIQQIAQFLVPLSVQLVTRLIRQSVWLATREPFSIHQNPPVNQQFQFVTQQNPALHVLLLT